MIRSSSTGRLLLHAAVLTGCLAGPTRADDSLTTMSATRDRPLFSPSRRPPPRLQTIGPARLQPAPALPPKPLFQLSGVIMGTARRLVILKRDADHRAFSVALGGTLDGWMVSEIGERDVTLRRGAAVTILQLPDP